MKKVALFDFCETIADFQTADAYVRYVQSHSPVTNRKVKILYQVLNQSRILGVARRLFPKSSIDKRFILKQLKGRSKTELQNLAKNYYADVIKPHFIVPVLDKMLQLQREGYKVYLVSGGYDVYLQFFAEEFHFDGVMSTKIGFNNGLCTGKFEGQDCMFDYKIDYIKSTFGDADCSDWYAFSDSVTDLPMLRLVGKPVAISRGKSQKWAQKLGIKEIIWNK